MNAVARLCKLKREVGFFIVYNLKCAANVNIWGDFLPSLPSG